MKNTDNYQLPIRLWGGGGWRSEAVAAPQCWNSCPVWDPLCPKKGEREERKREERRGGEKRKTKRGSTIKEKERTKEARDLVPGPLHLPGHLHFPQLHTIWITRQGCLQKVNT